MTLTPARAAALSLLKQVRTRVGWSHEILADAVPGLQLDERDTAFMTRLLYGVISAEGTLDEVLDRYLDRPSRVHPHVRDALRLGVYELLFMSTPARVAVHQGVEAVRSVEGRAAGLANAVLRRVAEAAPGFPWGDPGSELDALARATAHPVWMASLFVAELGWETARAVMEANNEPAPLYLAHNPFAGPLGDLVTDLTHAGARPSLIGPPGCVIAESPSAAVKSRSLADGACVVADAGAQFVGALAAPGPGRRAVELAAGRGTKSLLMQAGSLRAGGAGRIVSADLHRFKTSLLAERMERLGVPGITAVTVDTASAGAGGVLGGPLSADVVLVDAPCTGLGTLRRHPEKRWRVRPGSVEELASIGEGMLRTASRLVRPGGFVVYSTCTIADRENRQVVEGFLAGSAGDGFGTRRVDEALPDGWEGFVTPEGWFRSLPALGGPDGHFAAVLTSG